MQTTTLTVFKVLKPYQEKVEALLNSYKERFGNPSALRDACIYALLNGGKRFRPALVLMVAKALGHNADVGEAALCVEFFHTASLIADDLPCMDDEEERRCKPTVHKVYNEATALLTSYALIAEGYACLARNAKTVQANDAICTLALENAAYYTGLQGATGGQYLDLYPSQISLDFIQEIIDKKTVSLFELSFVLGWIYGGGELNALSLVKKCARHFGMAFQIADDIGDMEQDQLNGCSINFANVCGKTKAIEWFENELTQFNLVLKQLKLCTDDFEAITELLRLQVAEVSYKLMPATTPTFNDSTVPVIGI